MNFLAHLYLAAPTDASRIGNLLGDFARGTPESLRDRFPPEVLDGIVMHRKLDRFTDGHPAFHEARDLLAPERRRFAGIVVDVIFDHFLSIHWTEFSDQPLPDFLQEIYDAFDRHPDWLGEELGPLVPRIKQENWLMSYATLDGIALTFGRIASRSPRLAPIAGTRDDLVAHYQSFDRAFHEFFPDVRAYAKELLNIS